VITQAAARRTLRLSALLAGAGLLLLAGPAQAVPEGWSDPDPVSGLQALTVFVLGPIALLLATVLVASLPRLVGKAKAAPGITDPQPEAEHTGLDALLGGRDEPAALEARDSD
jgi:hypothetical protein